jgi:purine-nucleoside phosphorylase
MSEARPSATRRPGGVGPTQDIEYGAAAAAAAADVVRATIGDRQPVCAIILGSGLGGLAAQIAGPRRVPFHDVPGFPVANVAGHAGALIAGALDGREVIALAGRFHLYEGHSPALAGFPVRVLRALGAQTLFVSNAAGGIRRTFGPGTLMRIDDHINLMWRNPIVGALQPGDVRFPDMSSPYDPGLGTLLHAAAADADVPLDVGVYAGLLGPAYETPSEVRMLERLGADAVGMSTVPEVLVARALGMRVAGVSCITNAAAGISPVKLSHAEVLETTARVAARFQRLVRGFVAGL